MSIGTRLAAAGAAAVLAAGCGGDSKPASPDKVAVEWLQAKAAYDGGKEWDLTAPGRRSTAVRGEAVEKRKRERAQECPESDSSGCLFPKGVEFRATGKRDEGRRCARVFVTTKRPSGATSEGAVVILRVEREWRVREWLPALPQNELSPGTAQDCGA
jgi:hypothetical protein